MLRGYYTSATAMLAQSRRMDVITNNLVNVETAGFKSDTLVTRSFRDMLISRLNDPSVYQYSNVGPHNLGIHVDQVYTSFTQGSLDETLNPTDLALAGEGFYVIDYIPASAGQNEELNYEPETRYTRSGNFNVDANGYLVTPNGCFVQGQDGPVYVGTSDFSVSTDGTVYVNGEEAARLRVVKFEDNTVLRKAGDNTYTVYGATDENGELITAAEPEDIIPEIRQYFLETSNVDEARETVRMMETYRAYEVNQRMVTMFDESIRLTVNEIAKF